MDRIKALETKEVLHFLEDKKTLIIDTRPVDAYNGWTLQNEKRGGHIKGAKSLPAKWTKYIDWIEIVQSKNIHPGDKIIIYGYTPDEIDAVAGLFKRFAYNKLFVYYKFIEEWAADYAMPMDKLKRYRHLVHAGWVKALTEGEQGKTVICHAHYRNREAYLSGHIPGAIDIDTLALESPETWNRRSAKELKKALEQHGISSDTSVVLYGKFMFPDNSDEFPGSAAGHLGAIRCAFIMMYAGVKEVRVLNGGFQAWKDAAYEISYDDVPKTPIADFGTAIPAHPEYAVDIEEAKVMLKAKNSELICVRSWPEYTGQVSGYNYIEKKGRIPGAIYGNCGSDAYHMENYRNPDYTTRAFREIEKQWLDSGISPDKHLAFYCGTGWRGSEAFFNAWLMGWPKISVYDGGWFEWSNDPENPYETGIPE